MQENRISIKISDADKVKVRDAVATLQATLGPHLIALTNEERRSLPKVSDGTLPFVQKALDYAQTNPQFVPSYIDTPELKVDADSVTYLLSVFRPLEQIYETLDDTVMLAGSEAYMAALAFYNNVKQAVRMKVPGAEPIYADLAQRFAKATGRPPLAPQPPKTA